jgi:hypothetical protein
MKKNQLFILFLTLISVCFFSFESKAVSGYKSAPQDTCVTIKMKDGNEISAVLVEQTAQKVRFRKCGTAVTDTVFFVPMSKIERISYPPTEYEIETDYNKQNEIKRRKINYLLITTFSLSFLRFLIITSVESLALNPLLSLLFSLLGAITAIWAILELRNYNEKFIGRDFLILLLVLKAILNIIFFIAFLSLL